MLDFNLQPSSRQGASLRARRTLWRDKPSALALFDSMFGFEF
jgi:hypothetical protein